MLKINRQTDYAVRVILALAKQDEGARLSSGEIQKEMLIPQALMPRIVAQLARAGLLNTFPGREGGLMLPRHLAHHRHLNTSPFRADRTIGPEWAIVFTLAL